MSNAKLSSSDYDGQPGSGQRPAVRSRSSSAERDHSDPGGFSGTCENMSLSDWIQLVQMGRRDAIIGIRRHDGKKALLWCHDGDIIDAWCDGTLGEDAVYRALTWSGGQVSVTFASFERARRIEMATSALLLNAAYHKDSVVRHRDSLLRDLKPVSMAATEPKSDALQPSEAVPEDRAAVHETRVEEAPSAASSLAPTTLTESTRTFSLQPLPKPLWIASAVGAVSLLLLALSLRGMASGSGAPPKVTPQPAHATEVHQAMRPPATVAPRLDRSSPAQRDAELAVAENPPTKVTKPAMPPIRVKTAQNPPLKQHPAAPAPVLPTPAKSTAKPKPNPPSNEERAPRVQIIDEPASRIEVIE